MMKRLLITALSESGLDYMSQVFRPKQVVATNAQIFEAFEHEINAVCIGNLPFSNQTAILCYRLNVKIVFFYRDPRDEVIAQCSNKEDGELLLKIINSIGEQYSEYLNWIQADTVKHLEVFPLSYENLMSKPLQTSIEIKKFCKDVYPNFVTRIVESQKDWDDREIGAWKDIFSIEQKKAFWNHSANQVAMKSLGYYI